MSRMSEPCHIWISHVTYARFTSHMNTPCHIRMSHVPHERVMSHINEPCHTHTWVMSRMNKSRLTLLSHVTRTRQPHQGPKQVMPCHIWKRIATSHMSHVLYGWVTSLLDQPHHLWISHVSCEWVMSRMNESCPMSSSTSPRAHTSLVMSHMNESCHIRMSHVLHEWVMSHMTESFHKSKKRVLPCHMWMSHVTYEWVTSHMDESCHIWLSPFTGARNESYHITYEWELPITYKSRHIWMSHVTYGWVTSDTNESCHIWMSHVTRALQPRRGPKWVMPFHIWMRLATSRINFHVMYQFTHECAMSRVIESCHTCMSIQRHVWILQVT